MSARLKVSRSNLETMLAEQIKLAGLPTPVREHRFAPPRKWRFDFCWGLGCKANGQMWGVAVEVEGQGKGGVGRHQFPSGWAKDIEKA